MKETEKSLSVYLVIAGLLGTGVGVMSLTTSNLSSLVLLLVFPSIAFSIAFIYFGLRLKSILLSSQNALVWTMYLSIAYQAILMIFTFQHDEVAAGRYIWGILITAYIVHNVRRLAKEKCPEPNAPGNASPP